jgi:hypothetical protein
MEKKPGIWIKFFGVIAKGQTYLNYFYLFLAFPLGLIYFIFLVVGLSVGIATIIVLIGLAILLLVVAGWWLLAGFERVMANSMLKVDIPPMSTPRMDKAATSWEKLGAFLSNPVTWKSLVYLLMKFPLGILSFGVVITLTAATIVFLTAPLTYTFLQPEIIGWSGTLWRVDTLGEAFLASAAGILLLFVSLHIFNGLAWLSGRFARVMLGNPQPGVEIVSPS